MKVLVRFIPEDEPLPDEIEAIRKANKSIAEEGSVQHDSIGWDWKAKYFRNRGNKQ